MDFNKITEGNVDLVVNYTDGVNLDLVREFDNIITIISFNQQITE